MNLTSHRRAPVHRPFHRFACWLLLLAALAPFAARATTYYIDPAGDNARAGTAPETAWADFTHVNAMSFGPGDHILLRRGGTWHQQFQLHGSGAPGNFIEIAPYGAGPRPKIERSGNVADRCLTTFDVSYVKISGLEVCEAGAGIVIHYDHSYDHRSVYIDDVVAHGFYGIKINQVAGSLGYRKGTNGWEKVRLGGTPHPTYVAPDDVAFSYGIGVTGSNDTEHNNATVLSDFRVTNTEVYHAGCGVALDWNNHTNTDGTLPDNNRFKNAIFDNLDLHDIDSPWVSLTALFWCCSTDSVFKNSRIYRGAYYASGGTAQIHCYRNTNAEIDNIFVRTSVVPDPSCTDLSVMDQAGNIDLKMHHCTFENIAGYGFGYVRTPGWAPFEQCTGFDYYKNTFINIDYHWKNGVQYVFSAFGTKPSGKIHDNRYIYPPDIVLHGGSGSWEGTQFYANDTIDATNSGVDLARGKAVRASSNLGPGNEAAKIVDGDETSGWASPYSASPQWVQVDLGAVYPINEVRTTWQGPSFAKKYRVSVSTNGVGYTAVYNRELKSGLGTTDDVFTTLPARYVRLDLTEGAYGTPPNFGISTLSVFNGESVAQGRTTSASSTSRSAHLGSANAVDGNFSTRWTSDVQNGPQWFKVDLGGTCALNDVAVEWGPEFARSYAIAVSRDDVTYTTVARRAGVRSVGCTRDRFPLTEARYLKIELLEGANPGPTAYSICDITALATRDLARDREVAASSTSPSAGCDSLRAVDGNRNTGWMSASARGSQWFKVDLGALQTFNQVVTSWGPAFAKDYTIAVSADDNNYHTIVTRTGVASAGTTDDRFAATSARYLKITMMSGYLPDPTAYAIETLSVYHDLARGKAVTVSSAESDLALANLVDASDSSRWSTSGASASEWFTVDLGAAEFVDRVLLTWGTAYAKDYSIAVSTDGVAYQPIARRAGLAEAETTDDYFPPVLARYLKVMMTKASTVQPPVYSVSSVQVYGPRR